VPIRLLIALAVAAVVSAPATADACVCMTSCGSILQAELLFEATVVDIAAPRSGSGEQIVRLADVRTVRGGAAPDQLVTTVGDTCGYRFTVGTRYLVDARQFQPGRFSASSCGNTMPLADATGTLAFLLAPSPDRRPRLWGRVVSPFANQYLRRATPSRAIAGAVVTARGPVTRAVATTSQGDFAFAFPELPDGDYDVTISVAAGHSDVRAPESRRVTLAAGACAALTFTAPSTARVRSRVVDRAGPPVAGVRVEIFPLPYDQYAAGIVTAADSDADGWVTIDGVAPGRYAGGVAAPYPRESSAWAPALLRTSGGSTEIDVPPGGTVELPPVVAIEAPLVSVSGRVLTAPDTGVADAFIVVSALDGLPQARTGGARTDAEGRFTIDLHRGVRYRVMVERRGRVTVSVETVAGAGPIQITLPTP
jgi:hypothetical protein